ncbi:MAG: hypothetical protein WBJ59_03125, partial [Dysgonamonadaceae bacterium]
MDIADFEKRKQEYVKEKAGLTPEEAERYFPLNNELNQKKFELNRQHREKIEKMRKNKEITDDEYRNILENDVEVKLKEAELDKEYADKFKKVLSPEKLYKARQAEKNFIQQEVSRFRKENNMQNRENQRKSNSNNHGAK